MMDWDKSMDKSFAAAQQQAGFRFAASAVIVRGVRADINSIDAPASIGDDLQQPAVNLPGYVQVESIPCRYLPGSLRPQS